MDDTGENPHIREIGRYYVNTGTAILEPGILAYIRPKDPSIHGEAIKRARQDGKVFGVTIWPSWHHVLNINDYALTHRMHRDGLKKAQSL